jgi:hypothetical protein
MKPVWVGISSLPSVRLGLVQEQKQELTGCAFKELVEKEEKYRTPRPTLQGTPAWRHAKPGKAKTEETAKVWSREIGEVLI